MFNPFYNVFEEWLMRKPMFRLVGMRELLTEEEYAERFHLTRLPKNDMIKDEVKKNEM